MEENYQSEWTKSLPIKQQLTVVKRLFSFASPFKWIFYIGIFFALALSIMNVFLPKIIQIFIDKYLTLYDATIA